MSLTTRELGDMRAHANQLLSATCTIYLKTEVFASGKDASHWNTARASSVPCRLDSPVRLHEWSQIIAGQVREGRLWMLSFKNTQTVAVTDQVTVGSNRYYVRSTNDDDTERVLTRCICERLD